jgi:hypothetical protein
VLDARELQHVLAGDARLQRMRARMASAIDSMEIPSFAA